LQALTVREDKAVLRTGNIIPGERHGSLLVRELNLEDG
jgi:hypothetical protein